MRKAVYAFLASALLLAALPVALAFAWPGDIEGAPSLNQQSPLGYYLWHDGGFHLRTHGPGDEHLFDARLHTDGTFENVSAVRDENRDNFSVDDGGHELVIHFHTYNFTDGVDFTINGGDRLHLRLELDGQLIDTGSIYLGAGGAHPSTDPFTLLR